MNIERAILGGLMHADQDERMDAIIDLQPYEFRDYPDLLKTIIDLTLAKKPVDLVSVYEAGKEKTPAITISEIHHEVSTSATLPNHIGFLKAERFKEELLNNIEKHRVEIESATFGQDIEESKNGLIVDLSSIELEDKPEFDDVDFYKSKMIEHIESNKDIEGYSWGISELDKWTSGIVSPRVYVIGGLKKSGKTRFLIHTLSKLHNAKVPSVFLSLEMPAYEVVKLFHSTLTGLNDLKFRSNSYLKNEEKKLLQESQINSDVFALESKSGLNLEKIISRIRRFSKMGYKVIAIDYIQRISHNRNKQAQELEDIAIRLADTARQFNVSLIILSQLNAVGERELPNMGHLKGSGGIGESADTILLLDNIYRRTKQESDKNKIDIYIEQRHGDSGKLSLQSDLGACQFRNLVDERLFNDE